MNERRVNSRIDATNIEAAFTFTLFDFCFDKNAAYTRERDELAAVECGARVRAANLMRSEFNASEAIARDTDRATARG